MIMKKFAQMVFVLLLVCNCAFAQDITTFILVRHAEKASSSEKDPKLTEKGVKRSQQLATFLSEVQVDAIYSTDFIRTRNTVKPLADDFGLDINPYEPKNLESFIRKLIKNHNGQTVVISGHSNTTPQLVNILLGEERYASFDDSEYDWIFVVDFISMGNAKVKRFKLTVE
jgi:phosphohistidine phosphatase SixA